MAGAHQKISIELDDTALLDVLTDVINKVGNISPALKSIGEGLTLSTRDRMEDQIAPDGSAWEPLSDLTRRRKEEKGLGSKILFGEGALKNDSLSYSIGENTLSFGSNSVYAAMQHFGGTTSPKSMYPNTEIPARPFLGISDDDSKMILKVLDTFLSKSFT